MALAHRRGAERIHADDLPGLLRAYTSVQRLQVVEVERLYELVTARHAVTILVHAWRRQHDPAGAGSLEHGAEEVERVRIAKSG